jgi:type II secretory pathway pseudopilin PulG
MRTPTFNVRQRGVITIFISLMMLLLITVMIITAYSLSTVNLRAVGNVQARNEALSAAQWMIEGAIEDDITDDPSTLVRVDAPVDINNDGVADYLVDREEPECVRATRVATETASSVSLPGFSAGDAWNTIWEIRVNATEVTTGVDVRVVQGVRILLPTSRKELLCI